MKNIEKKVNPMRALGDISLDFGVPLDEVFDIYTKFTRRLYSREQSLTQENLNSHDIYGTKLTERYYSIKMMSPYRINKKSEDQQ